MSVARGDKDRAFKWLERAFEQRDGGLNNDKVDPLLVKLRGDPRHAALRSEMAYGIVSSEALTKCHGVIHCVAP